MKSNTTSDQIILWQNHLYVLAIKGINPIILNRKNYVVDHPKLIKKTKGDEVVFRNPYAWPKYVKHKTKIYLARHFKEKARGL